MKKLIIFMFLLGLSSCQKENLCKPLVVETYSNYLGYWDYCRYQSDEIKADLVLAKTDTLNSCETAYYSGLDTIFYKSLTCPRVGYISYSINIKAR
jgi:hypothetical protein